MTTRILKDHRTMLALTLLLGAVWLKGIYAVSSGSTDTDFFWHLRYGQWMLAHGAIPSADIFSWTHQGTPYLMTQWLGELIIAWCYNQGGFSATLALSVACCTMIFLCCWRAASLHCDALTASILTVMTGTIFLVVAARPQIFSFLGTAWTMLLVARFLADARRIRALWWMVPTMGLWVNLHGGYVIGIMLLCMCLAGLIVEHTLARDLGTIRRQVLELALIISASVAATCVNPWGWHTWESVVMISQLQSSRVIIEWQPVNVFTDVGSFYLLAALPYLGLLIVGKRLPRIAELVLGAFALAFGLLANRQIAICAAMMPFLTASALARSGLFKVASLSEIDDARLGRRARWTFGVVSVLTLTSWWPLQHLALRNVDQTISSRYPVAAADFLIHHGLSSRVMHDTSSASYLIHRDIPVFVDGRMDLYGDEFFFSWFLASKAAPGWDSFVAKWAPNAMLLRVDTPMRQAAVASGAWCQVYEDTRFSVLLPCRTAAAKGIAQVALSTRSLGAKYASTYQP